MTETEIKRQAIGKRVRFEVFKRDGFKCMYCGAHPPDVLLQCDHIEPVSLGGSNEIDNLITACQPCNIGKSNIPLSSVPVGLAEQAALVIERESQIAGYEDAMRGRRMRIEADAQEVLEAFCDAFGIESIPGNDFESIKSFIVRLGLDEVMASLSYAIGRKAYSRSQCFRYFCGVCWGKIRDREGAR